MADNSLPFKESKQSLESWLQGLNKLGSHRAGSKLYEALLTLYQNFTDHPQTQLSLLNTLIVPTLKYADDLEQLLINNQQHPKPLSLIRKTANLSCQLLRLLSLNYYKVSVTSHLNSTQQTNILYTSLHLIGLWQYKLAVLNQCPSQTAWKLTAELYQLTQKHQLLNEPVTNTPYATQPQRCIAEILQRNILFTLCEPYDFQCNTLKSLFDFSNRYYALLKVDISSQQAHFVWMHRRAEAPQRYLTDLPTSPQALYFNCQLIIDLLAEQNPMKWANTELQRLHQHFVGYNDIINSAMHTKSTSCKLIVDYFQIHEHLNYLAKLKSIFRASTQTEHSALQEKLLQLVPLHEHTQQQAHTPEKHSTSVDPGLYSVHPTQTEHYYITTVTNLPVHVNRPILFTDKADKARLGIIRQITAHPLGLSQQVLIEHISGTPESIQVIIDKEVTLAILITKSDNEKEVLLPPGKYQNGSALTLIRQTVQENYYFTQLLQVKASYLRYKISPG